MHRRKSSAGSLVSFKSTPPIFTAQTRSSRGFQRLRSSFNRTLVTRIVCARGIVVLVAEELSGSGEGTGAVLQHEPSREMPELVGGHIDAAPVRERSPDLLRQRRRAFVC